MKNPLSCHREGAVGDRGDLNSAANSQFEIAASLRPDALHSSQRLFQQFHSKLEVTRWVAGVLAGLSIVFNIRGVKSPRDEQTGR